MVTQTATLTEADRALRGVTFAKQMLDAGFTTVRDLGNSGRGGDVSLQSAIRQGWVEGPTMLVSTRALAAPGGQFPRLPAAHHGLVDTEYAIVRGADDARALTRQAFYEGADVIKVIVDNGVSGRDMTLEEVTAVVEIAHGTGKKVAALAVKAGVDSLEHAYNVTEATLEEMSRKKIFLVPTDYPLDFYTSVFPPAMHEPIKAMQTSSAKCLARALKAKVRIAAGSDAYMSTPMKHRGKEARSIFRAYADAGMTPSAIIQSATWNAAELLGLPAGAATLEAGSAADILVVRGDATADVATLSAPILVVKSGAIVRDFR